MIHQDWQTRARQLNKKVVAITGRDFRLWFLYIRRGPHVGQAAPCRWESIVPIATGSRITERPPDNSDHCPGEQASSAFGGHLGGPGGSCE